MCLQRHMFSDTRMTELNRESHLIISDSKFNVKSQTSKKSMPDMKTGCHTIFVSAGDSVKQEGQFMHKAMVLDPNQSSHHDINEKTSTVGEQETANVIIMHGGKNVSNFFVQQHSGQDSKTSTIGNKFIEGESFDAVNSSSKTSAESLIVKSNNINDISDQSHLDTPLDDHTNLKEIGEVCLDNVIIDCPMSDSGDRSLLICKSSDKTSNVNSWVDAKGVILPSESASDDRTCSTMSQENVAQVSLLDIEFSLVSIGVYIFCDHPPST